MIIVVTSSVSHSHHSHENVATKKKIGRKGEKIGEIWAQLPGRLFSPSDISKKLSHHFLLHFPIGMGSYDHHAKYQGVFPDLL